MYEWIPISIMLFSMFLTLILAWKWFGSLRLAFIIMLLMGKVWVTVLWAFGIDRPLFNIVIYNKVKGVASSVTITADMMVFLSFLGTLILTIIWPYIEEYLPEPIRRMEVTPR